LGTHFPQLEIIELLGQGGMGVVYKARQPHLDRLVALKVLPVDSAARPGFAERLQREARALARLNHPGVLAVYDFGQTGPYYYFVMEYVEGMNLRQLLGPNLTRLSNWWCGSSREAVHDLVATRPVSARSLGLSPAATFSWMEG
jgi:serine/threonine protein kinase